MRYLTADIPGIGGVIKQRPEDFLVEELPLYATSGSGEHLYLFIEKKRRTTSDMVEQLARIFRVRRGDVGYAGLKDKHAVTRQHFSIYLPRPDEDAKLIERVPLTGVQLLWSARHANKLQRGHLAGNRFVILIRGVDPAAATTARAVVDRLIRSGVPNYLGRQRFGYRQDNHVLGRHLLLGQYQELMDQMLGRPAETDLSATRAARECYDRGDLSAALSHWPRHLRTERRMLDLLRQGKSPQEAAGYIDVAQRRFLISGFQSAVFNDVLARRIEAGLFDRLAAGDLAWKHDTRAVFAVDEAVAALENGPEGRVPRLAVSPSGPMWAADMPRASGEVAAWETAALQRHGVQESQVTGHALAPISGSRRPMRTILEDVDVDGGVDEHGPYVRLGMQLGRGSFATVVLSEIMKNDVTAEEEES